MPFVQAGDVRLNYVEHGSGDDVIVFIHGNLGCVNWMDLVWPRLPQNLHVYAIDWRGCGNSDKPNPEKGYQNYTMKQHAVDMINAIKALGIKKSHLANHSTGGIICTRMLLMEPDLFGKVFCLDPVGPMGLHLPEGTLDLFRSMKENREVAFAVLATAAPSLFVKDSLKPFQTPKFNDHVKEEQKKLFNLIVDKTRLLSDGIWFGTAIHLAKEYESQELRIRQGEIKHPHLVLWGEGDLWIPRADVEEMAKRMDRCELKVIPGIGHSLNLEDPEQFARLFTEFFT